MSKIYDVFGMCNPLYDIQAEVENEIVDSLGFAKGGMFLVDADQQREIVSTVAAHIVNAEPGGSGANTMIGVSMLGGNAAYTGRVAEDEHGRLYADGLYAQKVRPCVGRAEGTTGVCFILVTPDAQRTMFTFLGIARELHPSDLDLEALRSSKYLYVTGYLWDTDSQKETVLTAMREARRAGVKVALSLSDPFCVSRNKEDFLAIIHEHVDLLIGNHEEAMMLTDTENPHDAIRALAQYCDLAAVTLGADGSLLREGDILHEIPAYAVTPVDTTGAGDMYAAGILYGLTHDLTLERTGRLAAYCAAQVVGQLGPRIGSLDAHTIAQIKGEA